MDHSSVHKILVIKLRAIGDVVLSTVVLKNLRQEFPDATIDFLTERLSRDVVEGNPYLDNIHVFDNRTENGLSLIMKIRRQRYDLVIDLFGNPRSAIVALLSGAGNRVGYRFGWRKYCYTTVVEPRGGEVHNIDFNLDALRAIDVPLNDRMPFFPCPDAAKRHAADFFMMNDLNGKFVVMLNPGGGWYTKQWRAGSYAELGKRLRSEFNARVLISWGPGEEALAEEIRSGIGGDALLKPKTTLKELSAFLARCSMMITNDSGPMHIAAVMGTPIVAIYGPTVPELAGPSPDIAEIVQNKELACLGCNFVRCPIENPCMEKLSVDVVYAAAKRLIERLDILKTCSAHAGVN